MAKKTKAQGNDTPIGRAAKEIAAARSKLNSRAVASGATPQKRVTRSSALRGLVVDERAEESTRGSHGDEASSGVESDQEEGVGSDPATARKKPKGRVATKATTRSALAALGEEVSSEETTRKKSLSVRADSVPLVHRGGQATPSDSDEATAVKKVKKGLAKRKKAVREEAASTDEGDRLIEEPASPKPGNGVDSQRYSSQGSSDKLRELERKLKNAEGQRR